VTCANTLHTSSIGTPLYVSYTRTETVLMCANALLTNSIGTPLYVIYTPTETVVQTHCWQTQ